MSSDITLCSNPTKDEYCEDCRRNKKNTKPNEQYQSWAKFNKPEEKHCNFFMEKL